LHKGIDTSDATIKESFVNLSATFSKIKDRTNEKRMRKQLMQGFKYASLSLIIFLMASTSHGNDVTIEMKQLLEENRSLQNSIDAGNEFIKYAVLLCNLLLTQSHVNATNTEIASLNAGLARTKEKTAAASM
jgi:bifunctional N-acetylglucosamine-1-phosphate-uridyltransferase/glucosamine-1-phosphate-acetyltransferase GlmU-like protein